MVILAMREVGEVEKGRGSGRWWVRREEVVEVMEGDKGSLVRGEREETGRRRRKDIVVWIVMGFWWDD